MNVCKWKGRLKTGYILCGKSAKEVESITTDDRVVSCQACLLLMTGKRSRGKHIHLNADFLDFANLNENGLLDFTKYKHIKDKRTKTGIKNNYIVCKREVPNFMVPEHRMTNDPKEVSCKHCLSIWGRKETKKFVLQGVLLGSGLSLRDTNAKLNNMSSKQLDNMLNRMLYGDKV